MTPRRAHAGFTLIEVIIAITIFAILSGMSYRVLTVVLETRERVDRENQRWREISLAITRIGQDISAVINRSIIESGGGEQRRPPLVGVQVPRADEGQLMLTRVGALDLPGAIGAPQRVGYRVRDGRLEMLLWPALDQGVRTQPVPMPLLEGVQSLELRYMDARGQWSTLWPTPAVSPQPGAGGEVPNAIELALVLAGGERIRRLFAPVWAPRL